MRPAQFGNQQKHTHMKKTTAALPSTIQPSPESDKPSGPWQCRICGRIAHGSRLVRSTCNPGWYCEDLRCEGPCQSIGYYFRGQATNREDAAYQVAAAFGGLVGNISPNGTFYVKDLPDMLFIRWMEDDDESKSAASGVFGLPTIVLPRPFEAVPHRFYDVVIIECATRKIVSFAGRSLSELGHHTVDKRLETVCGRLNEDFDAEAVPTDKYKEGDILPETP